jgi:broad specificity phosphatase PhoE
MGIEVLVVQHGEKARAAGDPGLTETGVRQAAAVATWLEKKGTKVSSIWASPLKRAQQTAEPIAAAFGLPVQTDARLRERMNWDDESEISLEGFLARVAARVWRSHVSADGGRFL